MNRFKKSQLLVLSLLTILLIIAPLLSSSLRPTYIYFIANILIIVLGAEAGLLSFFAKSSSDHNIDKKITSLMVPQKPGISSELASLNERLRFPDGSSDQEKVGSESGGTDKKADNNIRVVEKCLSEKIVNGSAVKAIEKVKKCPSMPSLFFIEGGDNDGDFDEDYYQDDDDDDYDDNYEEVGEISGQELFAKAENFIGNFYKQLKMQREESWKRIHGFYQRAF